MILCICVSTGGIAKAATTGHQGVLQVQTRRHNRKSDDAVWYYMTNGLMALVTNVSIPSRPRVSSSLALLQQWTVQIISLWHEAFLPASPPWSLHISFHKNSSTQSCSPLCCERHLFCCRFLRWFGSDWGVTSKGLSILQKWQNIFHLQPISTLFACPGQTCPYLESWLLKILDVCVRIFSLFFTRN